MRDGSYEIRLKGSTLVAVVRRDRGTWVGVTIKKGGGQGGQQHYDSADAEDLGDGPQQPGPR
jgi:hypothetical protein